MLPDLPDWIVYDQHQTGSSVICNPPVLDTDIDYCILVSNKDKVAKMLCNAGWKMCGGEAYENPDSSFVALRKDNLNYILVDKQDEYDRWEAAMLLAQKRNLTKKQDRIDLFRTIKAGGTGTKKPSLYEKLTGAAGTWTQAVWTVNNEQGLQPTPYIPTQGNV